MDFIDVLCIVASVQLINYFFKYDDTQNKKLIAANKIMREGLEYINDTLAVVDVERDKYKGMTWAESAIYKVATQSAKEAVECADFLIAALNEVKQ